MDTATHPPPDLVPPPRPPMRWRDWSGWRAFVRVTALAVLGVVLLFTLAVPNFGHGHCQGWEISAISTLRNISSAESQVRQAARIDVDGDGRPEFGGLRELSAGVPLRGGERRLNPPVLSGAFRTADATGAVRRGGYLYRLYLGTAGGAWTSPDAVPEFTDADGAEHGFRCYAWPARAGDEHALRTFVVDETGEIYATDDARYAGSSGPLPGAASGALGAADDVPAPVEAVGADGNVWMHVN